MAVFRVGNARSNILLRLTLVGKTRFMSAVYSASLHGELTMKKQWIFCLGALLAGSGMLGGCAMDAPVKPCHGQNCVSDAEITATINAAINEHKELTDWTVQVQTIDGFVYLHGLVDTGPQRELIENLARETRGVNGVENSIELRNSR